MTALGGKCIKQLLLAGVSLMAMASSGSAQADDDPARGQCRYGGDPYKNYSCLVAFLGSRSGARMTSLGRRIGALLAIWRMWQRRFMSPAM